MSDLFTNTLPPQTSRLISLFQTTNPNWLKNFYLTGGTALSLILGHRESEDLDFFNRNKFDPIKLQSQLELVGKLESVEIAQGTVNTYLNGVKLQFLEYPYKLIKPTISWNKIKISSLIDIACTKLQTVGMRGSKKDFIDCYFIFKQFELKELFKSLKLKYIKTDFSLTHILKSLVYFDVAEEEPMPRMHQDISWKKVKEEIIKTVKTYKI